ncbi:chorismate mutase 1, chloroplastic-like [Olea europaea subsp. europaea]|uniref:chorismate mutase n=1 Tax=Olea europaea subsp. europaea TaxID=158383 RepID=A0A8S0PGK3_OLEEU|nr:chorismate mutase 1, chloroplastic-like [Olea europaea subsp. europaea]
MQRHMILRHLEWMDSMVGRYKSPDKHPFFPDDVPEPILSHLLYPQQSELLKSADLININDTIWDVYFRDLLPRLVNVMYVIKKGDDGNYGSAAIYDTICCLLNDRIHHGKFVAKAKFRSSPDVYETAISAKDRSKLMDLLTSPTVEEAIKKRVEMKTQTLGQEVTVNVGEDDVVQVYKIAPSVVADLYGDWIMPLMKEVQVGYLLTRLD